MKNRLVTHGMDNIWLNTKTRFTKHSPLLSQYRAQVWQRSKRVFSKYSFTPCCQKCCILYDSVSSKSRCWPCHLEHQSRCIHLHPPSLPNPHHTHKETRKRTHTQMHTFKYTHCVSRFHLSVSCFMSCPFNDRVRVYACVSHVWVGIRNTQLSWWQWSNVIFQNNGATVQERQRDWCYVNSGWMLHRGAAGYSHPRTHIWNSYIRGEHVWCLLGTCSSPPPSAIVKPPAITSCEWNLPLSILHCWKRDTSMVHVQQCIAFFRLSLCTFHQLFFLFFITIWQTHTQNTRVVIMSSKGEGPTSPPLL